MPRRGRGGGRRGRGENRPWMNRDGNRFRNRPEDTWGNVRHVDRPRYLRGRAIGMYYHHMTKNQQTHKWQLLVTLRIPPAVEAQLNVNLGSITEIAKQLNIPISYPKLFEKPKKTADDFIPLFSKKQKPNEDHDIVDATKLRLEDDGIEWFPNKVEVIVVEDEEVKQECGIQSSASIKCDDKSQIKMSTEDVQNAGDVFTKPNSSPNCENKSQIKMSTEDIQDLGDVFRKPISSTKSDEKSQIKMSTEDVFTKPSSSIKCDDMNRSHIKMSMEDVPDAGDVSTKPNSSTKCDDKSQIKVSTEDIQDTENVFTKPNSSTKCDDKSQIKMSTEDVHDAGNVFKKPNFSTDCGDESQIKMSTEDIKDGGEMFKKLESSNKCDEKSQIKMSTEDIQDAKNVFIEPKSIPVSRQISAADSEPSTSTATHYIPIESDNSCDDYEGIDCERIMPLRSGSDYKYSYEDIITETFDEKLEECLNNGVNIAMSNRDIDEINKKLQAEYNSMVGRSGYQKMMKFRKTLPTFKKSQEILDVLNGTQVVVISGETGCGKSTQVPQIILDHAICNNNGANVKILVTQPRRIAASSLAERVANERGEKMGNSVGYAVRLERVEARSRGSILYCTTGILLADLEINQGLTNYSHIILDEVHERDTHVDLSMCMLKRVLQKRRDLKLILMSATIDAEKLSEYFDNCPMIHIEGLAFPVQDIYLEDILQLTKYKLPQEEKKVPEKKQKEMKYKKKKLLAEQMEKDIKYRAEIDEWLVSKKNTIDHEVYQTLQDRRIEDLNPKMISELMIHLCRGPPGAILVFLPGIGEITKLMRIMNDSQMFPHERYNIYPLHSKLPSLEQHQIFERPPNGIRKIIIATNIAETSITIDDIVYVIDCGKIKMRGLNVEEHVSTLKVEWAAVANLRQRRGRAGRCQPGICYHMVTSYRAGILPERLQPELQRSDLLEPVLTIKKLRLGRVAEALATVPAPPAETTVQRAVKHLQQCGALDDNETLTPLGWHLARLPVHPSAGKLLLLGALFGCLDRAASVAAVWGFKDPFQLVIGKEREVDTMKRKLALGEPSDHVAISEAIIQWEVSSYHQRRTFAYAHFLSYSTLQLLSDMKKQFGDTLKYMGFLASGNIKSQWENRNSNNLSLFKALVAASLYPNIAAVRWPNKNSKKYTTRQMSIKVRTTDEMRPIAIHPSSVMTVNHNNTGHAIPLCNKYGAGWLVYWLKQRSSDLFLLEVTLVYTLPLLFFGELNVTDTDIENDDECYMLISSVKVQCKKTTAKLLFQLRSMLDIVLASRIGSKEQTLQRRDFEELVLNSVIQLITAEDEQTDYLGDDEPSESDKSDNDNSETESLNYVLDRVGNNQPPMVPYTPRNQRYQNFSQFYN